MKGDRLAALREQQARLVARARLEREVLATTVLGIEARLSWVDLLKRAASGVRSHPLGVLAVLAVLAALRPRRTLRLLGSGWSLWQLYQRLRRVLALAAGIVASSMASRS